METLKFVLGLEYRNGEWLPGDWKLTVVALPKPAYLIQIPALGKRIKASKSQYLSHDPELREIQQRRFIELSAREFMSATRVARKIMSSVRGSLEISVDRCSEWAAAWNGDSTARGLKFKLIDQARLIQLKRTL